MKVLIAAGGTGGHIFPAITIAQTLRQRDPRVDVLFVGRSGGLEETLVPKAGFPLQTVEARGLPRRLSLGVVAAGWTALHAVVLSVGLIKRYRPDVAVGTGGYVSGPVIAAARLLGVPTVIQEQNAYPGLTNRWLGRFVHTVALGANEAAPYFSRAKRIVVTGNPIRSEILTRTREDGCRALGLDPTRPTLLLSGGSQGGASLNNALLEVAQQLLKGGVQLLWQTGRAHFDPLNDALSARVPASERAGLRLLPFIDDMAAAYAAADLVVSRAGALTLAELTARGVPAILIPYPHAAEGHQLANARVLEAAGAARIILDDELTGAKLLAAARPLLANSEALAAMGQASKALGRPDAAARIADLVEAAAARGAEL